MKLCFIILITLIALSCERSKNEKIYDIPNLKENIMTFINARKCFEKSIKLLAVNLNVKNDTLSVEIADTYPDIKEMKFNYDTVLYGYRIIFTGEKIKGYNKKSSINQFPSDIVEINQKEKWRLYADYTYGLFVYQDNKLVYTSLPCAERK